VHISASLVHAEEIVSVAMHAKDKIDRRAVMAKQRSQAISPTGVRIAADFRDNLIIDRYDPVFASMRAGKREHLRSENSEDAVTWNVFRSLRQVEPAAWLPALSRTGLPGLDVPLTGPIAVRLWRTIPPPPSLVSLGAEGESEIDVVIESPEWVWFIEAKYQSDISTGTTTRALRDQVLRNIDVGSYYAGVRQFFFTLLIRDAARSPLGVQAVSKYSDLNVPRLLLAEHRADGLRNLRAVTLLTWLDLGRILALCMDSARRDDEREYAQRAIAWIKAKGLLVGPAMNVAAYEALFRRLGFSSFESHKKLRHPDLPMTVYFNRDRRGFVWFAVMAKDIDRFDADLWNSIPPPQRKDRDPSIRTVVPKAGREAEAFRMLIGNPI
jgi:hypothetical protein